MNAGHGGARIGAGRKPKGDKATRAAASPKYADPLAYLVAVACGDISGDGLRVAAAKAALPYTRPRERAPIESPPPKELARRGKTAAAVKDKTGWELRAAAIREKHERK
jgi:hypothetical protein